MALQSLLWHASGESIHFGRTWSMTVLLCSLCLLHLAQMVQEMRTPRFGEKPMTQEIMAAFRAVKREDFFPPGSLDLTRVSRIAVHTYACSGAGGQGHIVHRINRQALLM